MTTTFARNAVNKLATANAAANRLTHAARNQAQDA
jgi:hypothetical protein